MTFPWMNSSVRRSPEADAGARKHMLRRELRQRAAMYYRLRYDQADATRRLLNNIAWDFGSGGQRPEWMTDDEITDIVDTVYARRPTDVFAI